MITVLKDSPTVRDVSRKPAVEKTSREFGNKLLQVAVCR